MTVFISNDFGTVEWEEKDEESFRRLERMADCLQMTVSEFAGVLEHTDRECPKCMSGEHGPSAH